VVRVYRAQQFKRWVDDLVATAKAGDERAVAMARHVLDELNYIKASTGHPARTQQL
jgi:hypothetical protein